MTDHDCGHNNEDHDKLAQEIGTRLAAGDLTVLIPTQSNEQITVLLQALAAEMYIRSMDRESFARNWGVLDNLIRETLLVESAEDSAHPNEYKLLNQAQAKFNTGVELDQSQLEAKDELRVMFEQHGVAEPKRPDNGQTFPGYL